jgi:hypothetical protein
VTQKELEGAIKRLENTSMELLERAEDYAASTATWNRRNARIALLDKARSYAAAASAFKRL